MFLSKLAAFEIRTEFLGFSNKSWRAKMETTCQHETWLNPVGGGRFNCFEIASLSFKAKVEM